MHIVRAAPVLLALVLSASARLVNHTIDDTRGDDAGGGGVPQYTSVHLWNARSAGDQCTSCGARPDGTQAFDETWHDETTFPGQAPSNVSFTFNGSVLYIFCILANNINVQHKDTRLAFYLDGSSMPDDQFHHTPDLSVDGFIYNQLVYKNDQLEEGEHEILVSNWADGDSGSLVLFDYAIYSREEPDDDPGSHPSTGTTSDSFPSTQHTSDPSSSSPTETAAADADASVNLGAVIGGSVAGGLVLVSLFALAFCLFRRGRQRRSDAALAAAEAETRAGVVDPFEAYLHQHQESQSQSQWNSPQNEKGQGAMASLHPGTTATPTLSYPVSHSPQSSSQPSTGRDRRDSESAAEFRSELERIRRELERVRQLAEPPEYHDPHAGAPAGPGGESAV